MKPCRFEAVIICASSLSEMSARESLLIDEALAAASGRVALYVIGPSPYEHQALVPLGPGDPPTVVGGLQQRLGLAEERTIVFGSTAEELPLAERAELYFHVGAEDVLRQNVRHVVPLWGQGASGVTNALAYFTERGFRDSAIEHGDIVDFVRRSIRFYESECAVDIALSDYARICSDLRQAFGDEIAGIFATGFPFYVPEDDVRHGRAQTPQSILDYLREQERYFEAKLLDADVFDGHTDHVFDAERAQDILRLQLERNAFDAYEYTSSGLIPPSRPDRATLSAMLAGTALDVRQDAWPCLYCVTLQAPDLFPEQVITKDTNETCLRCRQTSLMLRNVTGCSVDLDMVVVVRGDKEDVARRIKRHVLDSDAHLYDLDLRRTILNCNDGPVDLFVTTERDVLDAFVQVTHRRWLDARFTAVALWSLTVEAHSFNLGEDFPVAFDPQGPLTPRLATGLTEARRIFAQNHTVDEVVAALKDHSGARRQLMRNPDVVRSIEARMASWRPTATKGRASNGA